MINVSVLVSWRQLSERPVQFILSIVPARSAKLYTRRSAFCFHFLCQASPPHSTLLLTTLECSEDTPKATIIRGQALPFKIPQRATSSFFLDHTTMDRIAKSHRGYFSLAPYMALLTYIILVIAASYSLIRQKRNWRRTVYDIVAWSICMGFLRLREPREVWAFCFAIGYTTWNLLPGSFTSLDLPCHSTFVRSVEMQDKQVECPVCWEVHTVAQLPCGHGICNPCLQLMGKHYQTACPMCRRPLFSAMDWPVLGAMKSAVASLAITVPLCLLDAIHQGSRSHYRNAAIWFGCFLINGFWLWTIVTRMVIPRQENWWRLTAGQWRLGHVCVTFGTSVWSVGLMLWLQESRYR